jgi:hypothetical protein
MTTFFFSCAVRLEDWFMTAGHLWLGLMIGGEQRTFEGADATARKRLQAVKSVAW